MPKRPTSDCMLPAPLPEFAKVCKFGEGPRVSSACRACKRIKQKCCQTRPCSRCVRLGRADLCMSETDDGILVERPMAHSTNYVEFWTQRPFPNVVLKNKWAYKVVHKIWAAGYQAQSLANLFDGFPPRLSEAVINCLLAMQKRSNGKVEQLASKMGQLNLDPMSIERELTMLNSHMQSEAELWEAEKVYGFLQVSFDPETQQRRSLFLNSRFAHLCGFHKEEMLSRFANYDVEVPRPELDSLMVFLDDFNHLLDEHVEQPIERYYRAYSFTGKERRPVMIWTLTAKGYNVVGQFIKLTTLVKAITPEEYDEAVLRTPASCPLHVMGDRRSGRQLLDDLEADCRVTVRKFGEGRGGAALLDSLADFVADRCARVAVTSPQSPDPSHRAQ